MQRRHLHIQLLGQSGTGKKTLIQKYCETITTDKLSFTGKRTVKAGDLSVAVEITTGSAWSNQHFYPKANVLVLVCDHSLSREENNVSDWLKEITTYSRGRPVYIVMNKADLPENTMSFMQDIIASQFPYAIVSAKTSAGIEILFEKIIALSMDWNLQAPNNLCLFNATDIAQRKLLMQAKAQIAALELPTSKVDQNSPKPQKHKFVFWKKKSSTDSCNSALQKPFPFLNELRALLNVDLNSLPTTATLYTDYFNLLKQALRQHQDNPDVYSIYYPLLQSAQLPEEKLYQAASVLTQTHPDLSADIIERTLRFAASGLHVPQYKIPEIVNTQSSYNPVVLQHLYFLCGVLKYIHIEMNGDNTDDVKALRKQEHSLKQQLNHSEEIIGNVHKLHQLKIELLEDYGRKILINFDTVHPAVDLMENLKELHLADKKFADVLDKFKTACLLSQTPTPRRQY